MYRRWLRFLALLIVTMALDPLDYFYRLRIHRTAVGDPKLYIDGGFVNWALVTADPAYEIGEYPLTV